MKPALLVSMIALLGLSVPARSAEFNYAEALQKSLYFYEAQQSGRLSPNNRVDWRGASCLSDGKDIGKDLSGGWFDAGDHWTANLTMSFAAMTLAWSAVESPGGYLQMEQMDELLENLVHVNDYYLRCVLNPDCADPAIQLEVAIGCGGREGVDSPNVHAFWGPAEVADRMTRRPTFRLTHAVPGGDIPAAMAAAMAASSMVIRGHGGLLQRRPGFVSFKPAEFADRLLDCAEKLTLFAQANAGPVLEERQSKDEQERIRKGRRLALRSDGQVVETGYRADPWDKIVAAASWLQRAHLDRNPGTDRRWQALALQVYTNQYTLEQNADWWKDFGAGNFGKLAAFNLMRLQPQDERFHAELQLYCSRFCEYRETPGGLRLREWFAHEYGSLRHANNAGVIAFFYSDHVESAPVLSGNTWWKGNRTNRELRDQFRAAARRQVDYALGDNPYRRSFLVGFGKDPFNHVHHRGAYAAWAGFDHFIPGKADDRGTNRHVLYGALVAGPDHNDVFLTGANQQKWLPLPGSKDSGVYYQFPGHPQPVAKEGYVWKAEDPPVQEVMDSKFNEVALDYNAGITAGFAWLIDHQQGRGVPIPDSQFPPKSIRNRNTDLRNTDREYFCSGRLLESLPQGLVCELSLHNRSRWPARVLSQVGLRLRLKLADTPDNRPVTVQVEGASGVVSPLRVDEAGLATLEIRLPETTLHPGSARDSRVTFRVRITGPEGTRVPPRMVPYLSLQERLLPEVLLLESGQPLDPPGSPGKE